MYSYRDDRTKQNDTSETEKDKDFEGFFFLAKSSKPVT